jgi:multiple sugar transport system permease protein
MSALESSVAPARRSFAAKAAARLPFSPWHLVLLPTALIFAAPLIWLVLASFMSNAQLNQFPPTIIPSSLHTEGFDYVLGNALFPTWFLNSVIVSSVVVASNLVFCSLAGYAFARLSFRASGLVLLLLLATVAVPFQIVMISLFLMMKELGLVDTLAGVIGPWLVLPFGIFLLRQFFVSIPPELEEAARIDGCSRLRILLTIILPLARPALATVAVWSFLISWNELTWPLIITTNESNYTLQLGLVTFQGQHTVNWSAIMAGNLLTAIPMLLAFLLAQKTFIRSLASSAVKG